MAKLTFIRRAKQERGRQWVHHFVGKVKAYRTWKAVELTGEEPEVEEYVDEFTTRGEFEANRLIHRNKLRAAEYY